MADINTTAGVPQDVIDRLREETAAELALDGKVLAEIKAKLRAELEAELKAQMRDSVAAELTKDEIGDLDGFGFPKEYEKIVVFEGGQTEDLAYVTVQVNGYPVQITRGAEVIVNKVFVDALNAAIEAKPVKTQNGLVTREVHRFPFQRMGKATEAEYLAAKAVGGAAASVH